MDKQIQGDLDRLFGWHDGDPRFIPHLRRIEAYINELESKPFGNDPVLPSGIVNVPHPISPEEFENIKTEWVKFQGENADPVESEDITVTTDNKIVSAKSAKNVKFTKPTADLSDIAKQANSIASTLDNK